MTVLIVSLFTIIFSLLGASSNRKLFKHIFSGLGDCFNCRTLNCSIIAGKAGNFNCLIVGKLVEFNNQSDLMIFRH